MKGCNFSGVSNLSVSTFKGQSPHIPSKLLGFGMLLGLPAYCRYVTATREPLRVLVSIYYTP